MIMNFLRGLFEGNDATDVESTTPLQVENEQSTTSQQYNEWGQPWGVPQRPTPNLESAPVDAPKEKIQPKETTKQPTAKNSRGIIQKLMQRMRPSSGQAPSQNGQQRMPQRLAPGQPWGSRVQPPVFPNNRPGVVQPQRQSVQPRGMVPFPERNQQGFGPNQYPMQNGMWGTMPAPRRILRQNGFPAVPSPNQPMSPFSRQRRPFPAPQRMVDPWTGRPVRNQPRPGPYF